MPGCRHWAIPLSSPRGRLAIKKRRPLTPDACCQPSSTPLADRGDERHPPVVECDDPYMLPFNLLMFEGVRRARTNCGLGHSFLDLRLLPLCEAIRLGGKLGPSAAANSDDCAIVLENGARQDSESADVIFPWFILPVACYNLSRSTSLLRRHLSSIRVTLAWSARAESRERHRNQSRLLR